VIRSWITLLPALLCFAWFLGGVPVYWLHVRRFGARVEPRIEARRPSILIPKWLIYYLLWLIAPVEAALVRRRVSPNTLSTAGLVIALFAAAALAEGYFDLGGWLYLFVGIVDLFDGRVARATARVSRSGAFYDSVLDRYSECAVFCGLMLYYRGTWVVFAALCALFGSLMVSYVRAKAEELGVGKEAALGAMQRPERVFLLGTSLAASPFVAVRAESSPRPMFALAVAAILYLAVMSHFTAVFRTWVAFRALRSRAPGPPR
jgi:phosphatidylinositol phosphate synthase